MSTSYYQLMEGITSLRLETRGNHDHLSVWQRHGLAGTLVVDAGFGRNLASRFSDDHSDPVLITHWGGKEVGTIVTENVKLSDETTVVSEYGEVMTVAQVKARAGARRKDGMPTELFGFEAAHDPR